jgi:predicted DNA-binding transcriptional regulator YafY
MSPSPQAQALYALQLTDRAAFLAKLREALDAPGADRAVAAAKALGVSERTIYRWLRRYPELKR